MQKPAQPDLASALYPHLSSSVRQRAASEARAQAEQKERSARTAARLGEIVEQIRREKQER